MNSGLCVAAWLMANLIAVGLYDVYAYFFLDQDASVSYWLQRWFETWPMLAVFCGILVGHLCWPLHRRNGFQRGIDP